MLRTQFWRPAAEPYSSALSLLIRQVSGGVACTSGRMLHADTWSDCVSSQQHHRVMTESLSRITSLRHQMLPQTNQSDLVQFQQQRGKSTKEKKPEKILRVKPTTKTHRFSHYIRSERELELRSFWGHTRGVENPAFVHRYMNFSRIYARFRDLPYLRPTMREWDIAIDRLFSHSRGMQPANDLVRRHPYLLNNKIIPLQFAKNAVKGKLPMYDWRLVLRDLRKFVGDNEASQQKAPVKIDPQNSTSAQLPEDTSKL